MSSTPTAPPPAVAGVRGAVDALAAVVDDCLVGCTQDDLIALLDGLQALAARTAGLTVQRRDGGLAGRFNLPGLDGELFANFLAARAQPVSTNHGDASDPDGRDLRGTAQRQADALLDAIRHATTVATVPTVVVTARPTPGQLVSRATASSVTARSDLRTVSLGRRERSAGATRHRR